MDPETLGPLECLVETEETPENIEGYPDALELTAEGDIQMDTPVIS